MRFDLATVDWGYVAVLAALVFISTLVGSLLSFKHSGRAAVLSALVFAALFVFWTYYPHRIPGPRDLTLQKAADTPATDGPSGRPRHARRASCAAQSGQGHHASGRSGALGLEVGDPIVCPRVSRNHSVRRKRNASADATSPLRVR